MSEPESDGYKVGIVNSSTFGVYFTDLMDRLRNLGEVQRYEVDPNIGGRELAQKLNGVHYVIASVTPQFDSTFFAHTDDLMLIARHGRGCDNVNLQSATDSGVIVTRVAAEDERDAVAELSLSLIMTCIREVIPANRAVKENQWAKRVNFIGRELSHMRVGIIGYGNIGSRLAEMILEGFKTEVIAYDPNVADAVIRKNGVQPVELGELLTDSDLISLNASLNPDSYHLIEEEEIELMKDGVVLVNTARGELTDETALAKAVERGKIRALGVDVSEQEPMSSDHPLHGLENVYITPHIGSYTERSLREIDEKMVEDIEKIAAGELPDQIVNTEVLESGIRAVDSL